MHQCLLFMSRQHTHDSNAFDGRRAGTLAKSVRSSPLCRACGSGTLIVYLSTVTCSASSTKARRHRDSKTGGVVMCEGCSYYIYITCRPVRFSLTQVSSPTKRPNAKRSRYPPHHSSHVGSFTGQLNVSRKALEFAVAPWILTGLRAYIPEQALRSTGMPLSTRRRFSAGVHKAYRGPRA